MNKWNSLIAIGLLSCSAQASLIKYDISSRMDNIESGETFEANMEIVFDVDSYDVLRLQMDFLDRLWIFNGRETVQKSPNELASGFYEVFALFGPLDLISKDDVGKFFASEWKVQVSSPDVDVLSGLGTKGPDALGFFSFDDYQFGVSSIFDRKNVITVEEPSALLLFLLSLILVVTR
ncbi:hypothetical protein [Marinimicrobium sp. C2-29]|uniref:hypothetical protein n=1 Tax=Marinimicrobium sp. C2-29 TaxID=3139825 RepID=UPI003138F1C5